MKKYTFILLFLALVLAACGGDDAPAAEADIDVTNLPDSVDVATTLALLENDDVFVIDVREQWEYDEGHIPGIPLIPMSEFQTRLDEIPTDKEVIVTCRSGNRSSQVTDFLRQEGYTNIHNMDGGILAWQAAGYDVEQ